MSSTTPVPVPAAGEAFVRVRAGERFRVVDVQGGQVADLFAYNAHDVAEHLSAQHTRAFLMELMPSVGEAFYTNRRRPILTLEEDTSPGIHDMLIAACNAERYAELGVEGHHASCQENLLGAMARAGHPDVVVPQSVNLFMNIPVDAEGALSWQPALTAPGDAVTFRAEMDCVVVVSACPQDLININNFALTEMAIELLG